SFTREMDKKTVEPALVHLEGRFSWADERTLIWESDDPPTFIRISLRDARSTDGLWCLGGLPVAYTGEPPTFTTYDPSEGHLEQNLGRPPTDVNRAVVSPDGSHLLVRTYEVTTSRILGASYADWLYDREADKATRLPEATYVGWVDATSFLRLTEGRRFEVADLSGQVLRTGTWPEYMRMPMVSPDGRWLAGLVPNYAQSKEPDYLAPNDLILISLATGETQTVEDFVRVYSPPTEGVIEGGPAWSPDSGRLAAASDRAGGWEVHVYDLKARKTAVAAQGSGQTYPTYTPFSWSPDGSLWTVSGKVIKATPPYETVSTELQDGRSWWSPDGRWLVRSQDWGSIQLYRVRESFTDMDVSVFRGFVVGWTPDNRLLFIEWPDARNRYVPEPP
ncbi:MAG: WD40 repeat domain-containing protein, partial [Bacillota bacterium]